MALAQNKLEDIFGRENVHNDDAILQGYANDQSFCEGTRPDWVVFAETVEQVQKVVRSANETRTPLVPYSSGLNLHGAALPAQGGVVINLSRMNRILQVDEQNWFVLVEPGVTYRQLQEHVLEKGYRIMVPFGAPPGRSVLTSYLERDPVLSAASFEFGNYLIMDTEIVLPDGEVMKTGLWSVGGDAGGAMGPVRNVIYRLWTGAQGTLGIMTKMGLQITPDIKERRLFFFTFEELAEAVEPIKRIQRKEIGMECFLLNRFNLAALLSRQWEVPETFPSAAGPSESFEKLRKSLPPWVMVLSIQGAPRKPEKKISYEVDALHEVCRGLGIAPAESLDGAEGAGDVLLRELNRPWGILKKFNYRGSVHDFSFKTPLQDLVTMQSVITEVCTKEGYNPADIGAYVLPLERARAVHCEFDLHCEPKNAEETGKVKDLWLTASEALLNRGACFDRPYGAWADMVYRRAGNYTTKLKQIKAEMDPTGIMNPGRLCFTGVCRESSAL